MKNRFIAIPILLILLSTSCHQPKHDEAKETASADPLPSWNEGPNKKAILDFVEKTTKEGSSGFIPVSERIACFDNDGTLWSEQPLYFQLAYALDQVKLMASEHPEWKTQQPFQSILEGRPEAAMAGGEKALMKLVMATHANMTSDEFQSKVSQWIKTAKHPKTGKRYTEMVFQPMLELINYLKGNEYQVFIVSGGGVDFMRVWATEAYGIPGHQIIGSSVEAKYEATENGAPQVVKLPQLNFNDDKAAKPVGIWQHIGKRPVFAFGNSDGDYEMLQWTTTAAGYPRFGGIVHHTDAEREWAYDRESPIGRLSKGLDDAGKYNWVLVDMKTDWKLVYPENN